MYCASDKTIPGVSSSQSSKNVKEDLYPKTAMYVAGDKTASLGLLPCPGALTEYEGSTLSLSVPVLVYSREAGVLWAPRLLTQFRAPARQRRRTAPQPDDTRPPSRALPPAPRAYSENRTIVFQIPQSRYQTLTPSHCS
ncbi:hypothetical protein MSG28_005020 [Choristoneura fumiferana]|uniref:Uncharacterized protein n=1 Tax=Choristoneura fumiferana TaxID=7141 RepID=A0ACC0JPI6_CHOFU|nr:hypothetical protein MSG28_005020 [Choristoneura fumiferana]